MNQALLIVPCAQGYVIMTVSPGAAQLLPSVDWSDIRCFTDLDSYRSTDTVIQAVKDHFRKPEKSDV